VIRDDEIRQYAKSGYYAFQDYAVSNWFYHLTSSSESLPAGSQDICGLLHLARSFLGAYGFDSKLKGYFKNEVIENLAELSRRLPGDLKARTELFDLELRTTRIRSIIEELRDEGGLRDVSEELLRVFYGTKRFGCPRI
jgi:hypothetical protein